MKKYSLKSIEKRAAQILNDLNISDPGVPVDLVAKSLNLDIVPHDLGDNVSGVLIIDEGKGTIGYNDNESKVRQRFTIAHEIGHYVLHRLNHEIFVDNKQFKAIYRNHDSSTGEIQQEREANAFAAALLMPEETLNYAMEYKTFDLSDGDTVDELANKFQVSKQAMTFRIANLNPF